MRVVCLILGTSLFLCCVNPQKKALDKVLALEAELREIQDASLHPVLASKVLAAYSEFLKAYPDASLHPAILYKSGEVEKGLGNHLKSAEHFNNVHTKFPNNELAPLALFQQADCFEALDQRLTAKNTYEEFIERYPSHPYVDQAKGMIKLLYFSDDELIKQFQQ